MNFENFDFSNLNLSKPDDPVVPLDIDISKIIQLSQNDFQRLELHDQIYKEPDMYLGAIAQEQREAKILDFKDPSNPVFLNSTINYPTGCERTYLEILYNASDNVIESRSRNHESGVIQIKADNKRITINNGGIPIPIQINTEENKWVPEMIFGVLLTSGQYKKEVRTGSGKNGYGAKLTNIFSKFFEVIVGNPYDGKLYKQIWENNMKTCHPPTIEDNYKGIPFVQVTYELDFERFGYKEYPNEVLALYAAYAAEVAFTLSVPVYFNGVSLTSESILDFKKLTGYNTNHYIVHYEYPHGTPLKDIKLPNGTRTSVSVDPKIEPIVKLCIIDTPDEGDFYAFSNSSNNREGGVHVEVSYDIVTDYILPDINDSIKRKKDDKVLRKHTINKADLKRHMTTIISCQLPNPRWKSQDKLYLTEPKPKIKISDKNLKNMSDWEMCLRLKGDLEAKLNKDLGLGKKKKFLDLNGYDPAYYAGKKDKNLQCVLYEVEGKSAMGYAYNMKSEMTEDQRDYVGIFAQMGKPLNVMTAKLLTLINSKKYLRLIEALGLEEGLDYTKHENLKRLNYGRLALLNDSDVDGIHITALLLNQIYCRYRSLLQIPFIIFIRTPIIRMKYKLNGVVSDKKFYSHSEYNKFMKNNQDITIIEIKYYKGLASSADEEVAEESKNPRIISMVYDDTAPEYFNLAFSNSKGMTDKRKKWIANYQTMDGIEEVEMLPISKFLNFEFVHHAVANLARTIPRFDSLKIGQRKIIFGSYKQWKSKIGISTEQEKTNHLANHVSKISNYHHGEKSLIDTINNMILQYPGSNNMRFFFPKGQFGTRNDAGNDAGDARYTYCYPEWWFPYIFMTNDLPLLKDVIDEEKPWEPEVYLPIIPLILINGALGIGTGSSTFIPNFNPVDICLHLIDLISTKKTNKKLIPWYRGFKGTIELKKRNDEINIEAILSTINLPLGIEFTGPITTPIENFEENDNDNDNDDENDTEMKEIKLEDLETDNNGNFDPKSKGKEGLKMVTMGTFEIISNKELVVTEVPIGKSFKQYTKFLETLKEKKEIKDYKSSCKKDEAKFFVYGYKEYKTHEKLGLIKAYSLTNMVLLDEENRPQKFKDPDELLFRWYEWRLPYYGNRKNYMLQELTKTIKDKMLKMKFIMAVIEGTQKGYIPGQNIVLLNKSKAEILPQMEALGLPVELLNTKVSGFTVDDLNKLQNTINTLYLDYQKLEKTTPEELWIIDINKFLEVYLKKYPEEKTRYILNN